MAEEWISREARLPDYNAVVAGIDVLVTIQTSQGYRYVSVAGCDEVRTDAKYIAWKPMPKPYGKD